MSTMYVQVVKPHKRHRRMAVVTTAAGTGIDGIYSATRWYCKYCYTPMKPPQPKNVKETQDNE